MKRIKLPSLLLLFVILFAARNNATAQCPTITLNPTNVSVCAGVTAKFVVAASGTGHTYQWQEFDGVTWTNITSAPYSGMTTDTLTVGGSPGSLNGYKYRCVVSKPSCANVVSNAATLNLLFSSYVNVPPSDSTICDGGVAAFIVDADGDGITYKWQRLISGVWTDLANTAPYSGVTTNKLIVSNPATTLSGSFYRVQVGGTCPPGENSDSAQLLIKDKPKVQTQPSSHAVCAGTSVTFVTSANGTNVQYQWQEDQGNGFVNLPGALPYSGTYTNQLTILSSGVTAAKNGWKYRCVVSGDCSPGDTTVAVTLTVNTAPTFSSITQLDSSCDGENIDIEVIAAGSNLKYQWFENKQDGNGFHEVNNNTIFSGAQTAKLRISNVPFSFNGYIYYCDISGTCAPKTISTAVELKLKQDKDILADPKDTAVIINKEATFSINVKGSNLVYHWQVDDGTGFQSIDPGSPRYSGVTTTTLLVKNPQLNQSGFKYRCLVYGGCDTIPDASKGATLSVWWPASVNDVNMTDAVVYPNPVTGAQLTIQASNSAVNHIDVKIVDQFGRTLISENLVLTGNKASVDVSQLPTGVYSLFVTNEDASMIKTIKFTKL